MTKIKDRTKNSVGGRISLTLFYPPTLFAKKRIKGILTIFNRLFIKL